jgi:hypothetical protein
MGFLMLIWQWITAQLFCLARSIRDYGYGYTPGLRAVTSQRQLPAAAMKAIMGKRSSSAISSDPRQQEKDHFHRYPAVNPTIISKPRAERRRCTDRSPAAASAVFSTGQPSDARSFRQCLDPFKLLKILQDFLSHRIFRRMYEALNVGKKNN